MSKVDEELEDMLYAVEEEEENSHLWIISFSDFMTILMIFFLILFGHRRLYPTA